MKKFLIILLLFFSVAMYAQDTAYKYFKLENKQVYFEKVYILDSLDASAIQKFLTMKVPSLKNVIVKEMMSNIIVARIENCEIDYRKYGGHWANTAVFLNWPMFGEVSIVWKDNKYKVTVSNIYFNVNKDITSASDIFTQKHNTEFKTSGWQAKNIIKADLYVEQYLDELFTLIPKKNDNF